MWWLDRGRHLQAATSVDCAIGDFRVALQSDLPQVLDDFVALYRPAGKSIAAVGPVINLEVRRAGRTRLGRVLYEVYADGEQVGGPHTANGVFPLVEWGINLRIMATRNQFTQFHAASMALGKEGFIFAGNSGCGKSTLAAILLAKGWQYLCDEFALLHNDSLMLQPFPKALCIKAGSYPIVRKLGLPFARRRDYVKAFKGRVGYINPRHLGADRISSPVRVRYVVFPDFKANSHAQLTSIPKSEAAMELYRCCFNKSALTEFGLRTISRLVMNAECFRLTVGGPAETATLLASLCRKQATKLRSRRHQRSEGSSKTEILRFAQNDEFGRASESRVEASDCNSSNAARRGIDRLASRREALKLGAKLAYVAPCVLTLTSRQAFAAASNPSGICSTASHTGQLCETDMDCCSRKCNLGMCQ